MNKKKILIVIIMMILAIILGYFAYNKVQVLNRKYEIEEIVEYSYFVVKQDSKMGVIDANGNIIIEAKYTDVVIPNPSIDVFICYEDETINIFNKENEEIFTQYESAEPIRLENISGDLMYEKSVLIYKEDEKYGLIDLEGSKITKAKFDSIKTLSYKEGELLIEEDSKYGVINIKGNYMVDCIYDTITIDKFYDSENQYKEDGYIVGVKTDDGYRYGYVSFDGEVLLDTVYNDLSRVIETSEKEEIYLIASENGLYGVYKNDELIINHEYNSIRYGDSFDIFIVEKSGKYGALDFNANNILNILYSRIDISGIYMYAIDENNETCIYDENGNNIDISDQISILETENENYEIKINSSEGLEYIVIDTESKLELTYDNYSYLEYLYDNYFIAAISGKIGIIEINEDTSESQIIEIKYDSVQKLDNTELIVAKTTSDNMTYILNKQLEQVITLDNAIVENCDSYIKAYNDSTTKYLSNQAVELTAKDIFNETNYIPKQLDDGKWTLENVVSGETLDITYDKITEFNSYGFAGIRLNDLWGVIDSNGEIILEPIYEFNNSLEPSFIGTYYMVEYGFGEIYYTK